MKNLNEHIHLRVSPGFTKQWKKAASRYGTPSTVHRDLLTAFVEGRVKITADPTKPKLEDLK